MTGIWRRGSPAPCDDAPDAWERALRLVLEAGERLETEAYRNLFGRPLEAIVVQICHDLGLEPPAEPGSHSPVGFNVHAGSP